MENNQNINKKKKKHYHFNHKKTNIAKETVSNDLKEEANNSNIKVSEPKNIIKNVKSQKVNNVVKPNVKKEDNNIKKNDTKKIQNTQKPNNVVKKNEPKKDNSQKQSNIKADVSVKSGNKSKVEKSNQIVNNNVKEKNIKQDNKPQKDTIKDNSKTNTKTKVNKLPKEPKVVKVNEDLKIYSLGGLGVVGMNMYIVEMKDELIIIDAGILFADDDDHGVNYIIPDFTHLVNNEKKIVGLFITHGHEDHIGGIPFLLEKVKVPVIYASGIAVPLIHNKMSEFPNIEYNIKEYGDDSEFKYNNFEVSFFRTNHSIPDSFGLAIKTKYGYVVNTGDFKFDFNPIGHMSDFYKMTKLGEEGVICLLSESTNAKIVEFSSSERKIGETLHSLFNQIEGRIIVATFASNVYRVQQIISSSVECGRKVIVFGHSMEKTIEAAIKLKYINVPKGWILKARELKKIETEHVTILCTGSQGEPLAALSRIASGTHKQIKLLPDDTIIYSSKPIPGNEQFINRNINKLVHAGAHVIKNSPLTDTHTTGHASQNELRMMLAFTKPKYFVPVHGEYAMLKRHVEIAEGQGIPSQNCFVLAPGDVLNINEKGAKVSKKVVPASDTYLDASLSDVDSNVLKERRKMADEGLVSVNYFIDKKKKLIGEPIVTLNGFATPEKAKLILEQISTKCDDIFKHQTEGKENYSITSVEKQIQNQMYQYIYQKMDRTPLIVVSIIQVK